MKREDLLLILLFLALAAAALLTLFSGGGKSRHGYGAGGRPAVDDQAGAGRRLAGKAPVPCLLYKGRVLG